MTGFERRGQAEGDDFRDVCTRGADCPVCGLWPTPGESSDDWKARLRRIYDAAPMHNADWREEQAS